MEDPEATVEIKEEEMKKYRLKKDLPTFRAGDLFELNDHGLCLIETDGRALEHGGKLLAYCKATLEKFPNMLEEWFEEIPEKTKTVWDLKTDDVFYVIEDGRIAGGMWNNGDYAPNREAGDIFLTKQEAEKELVRRKVEVILKRDTKGFTLSPKEYVSEWWIVVFDFKVNQLAPFQFCYWWPSEPIKFANKKDAEESIKKHEKEWKIYLGVEE